MFHYKLYLMLIREAFPLLAGVHQASVTDAVDPPRDSRRFPVYLIHCLVCKDILPASRVLQMGLDIAFRLRAVQMRQDTAVYYGKNVPLFRRNGYRKSGAMIP